MPPIHSYVDVLSAEQIASLFALDAVQTAKQTIDARSSGSVYFSVPLSDSIKIALLEKLGLDLSHVSSVPLRWMKGDTAPHVDTGATAFDNTYLMYLTDSDGSLIVDGQSYPMTQGSAYVFPESLTHETRDTGLVPRLLLGPMSEAGFAVGGDVIGGDGGTKLFIRQSGSVFENSDDQINWFPFPLPINVENTDTSAGVFTIEFTTDMTLTTADHCFVCGSSHIQFGSSSLKTDGTRPVITIDGVTEYPGLIQNGSSSFTGQSNIYVYNLDVRTANGSILNNYGGWIGHSYFGKAATDNFIINCSSDGAIGNTIKNGCGGIVGAYASSYIGSLTIIGCSSSGNISYNSGGIVGTYGGADGGTVSCVSCWSTGNIVEVGGEKGTGGIFGQDAGNDSGNAIAENCYSTGAIGTNCGGIYAPYSSKATALNCYSRGTIDTNGGGIFGAWAGYPGITSATNCYSAGTIATSGNGIYGSSKGTGTETSCYAANGSWSSSTANTSLTGTPSPVIGITWVSTGTGQPYELYNMGYIPYTIQNIDTSGTPSLSRVFSATVAAGGSTPAAIISGKSYTILQIVYGDSGSYNTFSMDATTGVISTTSSTVASVYTIYLRNNGSYNITRYIITTTSGGGGSSEGVVCCEKPLFLSNTVDNTMRNELIAGNVMVANVRRGPISHAEVLARKKANASKR